MPDVQPLRDFIARTSSEFVEIATADLKLLIDLVASRQPAPRAPALTQDGTAA